MPGENGGGQNWSVVYLWHLAAISDRAEVYACIHEYKTEGTIFRTPCVLYRVYYIVCWYNIYLAHEKLKFVLYKIWWQCLWQHNVRSSDIITATVLHTKLAIISYRSQIRHSISPVSSPDARPPWVEMFTPV